MIEGASYAVLIDPESFQTFGFVNYTGLVDQELWQWTVSGARVPSYAPVFPLHAQTAVPLFTAGDLQSGNFTIQWTFSEAIRKGSGLITLYDKSDVTFETVDVQSPRVVVTNTEFNNTVTATFSNLINTKFYYVLIAPTAFHSYAEVDFPGIVSISNWTFITEGIEIRASALCCTAGRMLTHRC